MIREDTSALSLPEGRRVGQPGHEAALRYIERRMTLIGLGFFNGNSFRVPYRTEGREFTNLAGVIPGNDPEAMPILLGAHYDSAIDGPCTDDNAVSVAVILSLAEKLIEETATRTVIIVFFDAEERPYFETSEMGSVRFCEDHSGNTEFAAVIILDAIGHNFEIMVPVLDKTIRRIRQFLFVLGAESHSKLPGIVEDVASSEENLRVIPTLNRYIGDSSDYMAFRKAQQPYLFISRGNGRHTHTLADDMTWINWPAVDSIADMTLTIIQRIDAENMEEGRNKVDPYSFEIRLMKKAAGFLIPILQPFLGISRLTLKTRADLDALAAKLSDLIRIKR